jgi:hypothetical protein
VTASPQKRIFYADRRPLIWALEGMSVGSTIMIYEELLTPRAGRGVPRYPYTNCEVYKVFIVMRPNPTMLSSNGNLVTKVLS